MKSRVMYESLPSCTTESESGSGLEMTYRLLLADERLVCVSSLLTVSVTDRFLAFSRTGESEAGETLAKHSF